MLRSYKEIEVAWNMMGRPEEDVDDTSFFLLAMIYLSLTGPTTIDRAPDGQFLLEIEFQRRKVLVKGVTLPLAAARAVIACKAG